MHVVLMVIGVLASAIGAVTIGLGFENADFSFGNTLIISGTTALSGGLILIGLAAVARQLMRVAAVLSRPMPRPVRPMEPHEVGAGARPAPRIPFPPKPPARETPTREMQPREPRLGTAPPREAAGEQPPISAGTGAAPATEPDEVPLSPLATPAAPEPSVAPAAAPGRMAASMTATQTEPEASVRSVGSAQPEVLRGPRLEPPWRPTLPGDRQRHAGPAGSPEDERPGRRLFDSLWPADTRRKQPEPVETTTKADEGFVAEARERGSQDEEEKRSAPATPTARSAGPDTAARVGEQIPEVERAGTSGAAESAPTQEPARPERGLEGEQAARASVPSEQPAGEERRPVSILKSGVVDGMAYTLYSDGSIEAELPEGTIRFSSIEELRRHLNEHS